MINKKTEQTAETLMAYLTSRRMVSLGNLVLHFETTLDELIPVLRMLQLRSRLRLSQPRCAGSCSQCEACEEPTALAPLSLNTIAVSLEGGKTL